VPVRYSGTSSGTDLPVYTGPFRALCITINCDVWRNYTDNTNTRHVWKESSVPLPVQKWVIQPNSTVTATLRLEATRSLKRGNHLEDYMASQSTTSGQTSSPTWEAKILDKFEIVFHPQLEYHYWWQLQLGQLAIPFRWPSFFHISFCRPANFNTGQWSLKKDAHTVHSTDTF
jgi:hypothetical protein